MGYFPAVDPIPLPAPVWLFKALHTLTLVLHFFAVHLLVGGLAMATVWAFWGRRKRDSVLVDASGAVTNRLPTVMTYVVNLGVPPLLFAQVLYGRALYTSSVLIGAWWISVVALLMASYALLYYMSARVNSGRAAGWAGFISLLIIMKIGAIYTNNMSLMLRPTAWLEMYRLHPEGTHLASNDPTMLPRWLFMMLGSGAVSGLALMFLALKQTLTQEVRPFLQTWGGRMLAIMTVPQALVAVWVVKAEPEAVRTGLAAHGFYTGCAVLWFITALVMIGGGAMASLKRPAGWAFPSILALAAFLNVSAMVLYRDGIRDVALSVSGYDVWNRAVNTNWSTVILFVLLLVVAIVAVGWLISVLAKAKSAPESYALD